MVDPLLTVFDGTNLLVRSHFGINRGPEVLSTRDGRVSGALYTLVNTFFSYVKDLNPSHTFWSFDKGRSRLRLSIDSQYKANRDNRETESGGWIDLTDQKVAFQEFLNIVQSKWYSEQDVEADDLLGQVVRFSRVKSPNLPIVIVSSDHDLYQLVDDKTSVLKPASGAFSSKQLWTASRIREEWGVDPKELPLLWAMIGDEGDNIKGVKGIGPKTARRLYNNAFIEYGNPSIHQIIEVNSDKLGLYKNQILRAYQLVQLYSDQSQLVLESLDDLVFTRGVIDHEKLYQFFESWDFLSLIRKLEDGTLWL